MSALPTARRIVAGLAVAIALATGACAPAGLAPSAVPSATVSPRAQQPGSDDAPPPSVEPSPAPEPEPSVEPTPSSEPTPSVEPSPTTDPTATAPPTPSAPPALMALGDEGDDVRALQHRLQQIQWMEGPVSGTYDDATRLAVEGFQAKRGIPVTGQVDQTTLDRLVAMTREPTRDEMYNIMRPGPALLAEGATGDAVKDLQARLKQIGWYAPKIDGIYGPKTAEAVSGFQGKRQIPVTGEVDQRTKDRLYAMTRKPTSDELNNIVATPKPSSMTLDDRCLSGRVICISKSQRRLAWVVDGSIRMTMDVRFGSELTPTRNGVFSVYWKSRDHVSSLYDTPMPYALFFSGGQAVHYSADFARNGYNGASHGCVNVRDKAAVAALFDTARVGDKVVVY